MVLLTAMVTGASYLSDEASMASSCEDGYDGTWVRAAGSVDAQCGGVDCSHFENGNNPCVKTFLKASANL